MGFDENISLTLGEIYKISLALENDIDILELPLSKRTKNGLMRSRITKLAVLLNTEESALMVIPQFGKKCIEEIRLFLSQGIKDTGMLVETPIEQPNNIVPPVVKERIGDILSGRFEFVNALSKDEQVVFTKYFEAIDIIGRETAELCYRNPKQIVNIINSLVGFCSAVDKEVEVSKRISEVFRHIPHERHYQKVSGYIDAFTRNEEKKSELSKIYNLDVNPEARLNDIKYEEVCASHKALLGLLGFLKWCSFDVKAEVESLFEETYVGNRMGEVLKGRASGQTLQDVGETIQVTRERVRQIEAKAKRIFGVWQGKRRILSKISAIRNSDTVLSAIELKEYFGDYYGEMIFLLRTYESAVFVYDAQLDVFILGGQSLTFTVYEIIESLPSSFTEEQYNSYVEKIDEEEIPLELFEKALFEEYQKNGSTYHRINQTLGEIYLQIINKYYPEGISIYDNDDIRRFREIAIGEYGCKKLPDNDRALYSRIQSVCIMCDRGKYKPKSTTYIPKELSSKIYNYIANSESNIFLSNVLFSIFEDELIENGIDNKYYMNAVLKELYGDKFFFRKDYISKDDTLTSINAELIQFIKKFDYPIVRADVQKAFPGITEIVFQMAIADPNIINMYGKYIHGSRLPIFDADIDYLRTIVNKFIANSQVCYYGDIYNYVLRDNEDMLKRLFINVPTALFSVLEYLFKDEYQFQRPYIANYGVEIGNPNVQLKEIILSSDRISFADITDFMKEKHYQVYSYLDYYNGFSDTHLLADNECIATYEYLGIDGDIIDAVVTMLEKSIYKCLPIKNVDCIRELPIINVPWHEWLIYSIVRKYSRELDVSVTSTTFKQAVPLIAPKGNMDTTIFVGQDLPTDTNYTIDDLDNIDDLIADFVDLDEDV